MRQNNPLCKDLAEEASKDLSQLDVQIRKALKLSSRMISSSWKFDKQDAFLEVTAGAGGLEAGVLACEIKNFYIGYCQALGFEAQILEMEDLDVSSNLKAISRSKFCIQGQNVFHALKYECGVHRVQRVPSTGKTMKSSLSSLL